LCFSTRVNSTCHTWLYITPTQNSNVKLPTKNSSKWKRYLSPLKVSNSETTRPTIEILNQLTHHRNIQRPNAQYCCARKTHCFKSDLQSAIETRFYSLAQGEISQVKIWRFLCFYVSYSNCVNSNWLMTRTANDTLTRSTKTKPRQLWPCRETKTKEEPTNADGITAEERPDSETSLSVSNWSKNKVPSSFLQH
jgi:hypothetical protein